MTPDVFSSPAIEVLKNNHSNGDTPVKSFVFTAEKNRRTKESRIPIAPRERTVDKNKESAFGGTNIPSPSPWEAVMDGVRTEQDVSFTHYINPLADVEDGDDVAESHIVVNAIEEKPQSGKVAFEMQTPEAVQILNKISTRIPLSNVNENVLDFYLRTGPKKLSPEPSTEYDIFVPRVQQRAQVFSKEDTPKNALESSEDENVVSDGEDKKTNFRRKQKDNEVMEIASPILEGRAQDSPEEIPPTVSLDRTQRHDVSPVSFNLDGSPDSAKRGSCLNNGSFSFGMAGEHQTTAKLINDDCEGNVSGGESVDQPNPFASMMGRLREEPACIKSPIVGKQYISNSPVEDATSPKSPSQCTPMNLISASGDGNHVVSFGTPDLGQGEVDAWIERRGLSRSINTPTRKDIQKMWNAVRDIRETTEAYHDAMRANAQLCEELAELQEAELEARTRAEEEGEIARHEMKKSQEISAQMMELSTSMYREFSRCEEERRSLYAKLEEAKRSISECTQDGVHNILKDMEHLKAELASIRQAEATARAEAQDAKQAAFQYEEKLKEVTNAMICMEFENNITDFDGVKSKVEYFEALGDVVTKASEPIKATLKEKDLVPTQEDLEYPTSGRRAPQTTPVNTDYSTTPYRIYNESIQAFRESLDDASTDDDDSGSDYQAQEIVVSPIAADGLTKSTLRETVRDRLLRLRTELQDAKVRLNHVELGLHGKGDSAHATPKNMKEHAKMPGHSSHEASPPNINAAAREVNVDMKCEKNGVRNKTECQDTYLPQNGDDSEEVIDDDDFHIPAAMATPASNRSIFARRLESMATPMSLKRAIFSPNVGTSVMKSTARCSPQYSSSSCRSPSVLLDSMTMPRPRRFGHPGKHRSESDEREFRRRAAALKIHVSPYFKRRKPVGPYNGRQEIDTVC